MTEDQSLFDITTLWFAGGSEGFSHVYALTESYAYSNDPSQLQTRVPFCLVKGVCNDHVCDVPLMNSTR
jgi:hypothetical protein